MTKAEARARFYARAALAGDPPVSMMAVPHKTWHFGHNPTRDLISANMD